MNYATGLSPYEHKGKCGMPEKYDTPDEVTEKIRMFSEWVKASKKMVVITGAGISTSCGIPDFRGPKGKVTKIYCMLVYIMPLISHFFNFIVVFIYMLQHSDLCCFSDSKSFALFPSLHCPYFLCSNTMTCANLWEPPALHVIYSFFFICTN